MVKVYDFVRWFLYITTGILVVCALNLTIMGADRIPTEFLWDILAAGFLTALVTVFLEPGEHEKKTVTFMRYLIHYAALCLVMIVCGSKFGWMKLNSAGIAMMMVSVAAVYLFTFGSHYIIDMKRADEINKKLKEKYGDK